MEMVKWIRVGQVHWKIFITPHAFESLLDGHATNEQHE